MRFFLRSSRGEEYLCRDRIHHVRVYGLPTSSVGLGQHIVVQADGDGERFFRRSLVS
jgi:hypothetical protein